MSTKLQEIKARGLAERKKQSGSVNENRESCFFRQLKESSLHPRIIKQARKTGILNLSSRGISEMPDIVWNITNLTAEENKALSVSLETNDDDKWWDFVDLTKLILASNTLKFIPAEIANYKRLNVLDLHDNCLSDLPNSLGDLVHLTKLNLSRNQFHTLPNCIFMLKSLQSLQVQHNKLQSLSDDVGSLSFLEELDLSNNQLKKLPCCIGFCSRITNLNLSNNELLSLPVEVGDIRALKILDLSKNKLKSLQSSIGMLNHLEQIYLQHNYITEIPPMSNCSSLKEIHAGFNSITELSEDFMESVLGIKILDLRDNKISQIPDTICSLQSMERLDVSNNNLSSLPFTLGTLPHLKFLAIEGNPMRSIRRDIIQRGTVQLLRWLRSRLEDPKVTKSMSKLSTECDGEKNPSVCEIDKFAVKSTKTLPLSNKKLVSIPKDLIETAADSDVTVVDLSKNAITEIPEYFTLIIPKATEINFGYNKLAAIPSFFGLGKHLQYLDFRNNQLQDLPNEISSLSLLREINISCNRFSCIPSCLFGLKHLEIILASDNKILSIDVSGLSHCPALAVLDLHNNSIQTIPPELGNLRQLRSLLLDGNLFRNPRPAILAKGTSAILEFLRSRIPQV